MLTITITVCKILRCSKPKFSYYRTKKSHNSQVLSYIYYFQLKCVSLPSLTLFWRNMIMTRMASRRSRMIFEQKLSLILIQNSYQLTMQLKKNVLHVEGNKFMCHKFIYLILANCIEPF